MGDHSTLIKIDHKYKDYVDGEVSGYWPGVAWEHHHSVERSVVILSYRNKTRWHFYPHTPPESYRSLFADLRGKCAEMGAKPTMPRYTLTYEVPKKSVQEKESAITTLMLKIQEMMTQLIDTLVVR